MKVSRSKIAVQIFSINLNFYWLKPAKQTAVRKTSQKKDESRMLPFVPF